MKAVNGLCIYGHIMSLMAEKMQKQKVCQSNIIEMHEYFEADAPTS